jgi:uncharacterized protein YbaA (DUF1428 family)
MQEMDDISGPQDMPFDVKRMLYGGFTVSVGG